jgi:hypothetical protein
VAFEIGLGTASLVFPAVRLETAYPARFAVRIDIAPNPAGSYDVAGLRTLRQLIGKSAAPGGCLAVGGLAVVGGLVVGDRLAVGS